MLSERRTATSSRMLAKFSSVTIALAFRAYLTEPQLLPELVEIDGLPDDLRDTLAGRLKQRR